MSQKFAFTGVLLLTNAEKLFGFYLLIGPRMGDVSFEKSVYSRHFNILKYMGGWVFNSGNSSTLNAYTAYQTVMHVVACIACVSLFVDFYFVFGDVKKMMWNLCVASLFVGGFTKNVYSTHRSNVINNLRVRLHRREMSRKSAEDEEVNRTSAREMRLLVYFFYVTATIFASLWFFTYYLNFQGDLPVPIYLPFEVDYDDEVMFNLLFFLEAIIGCVGLTLVIETELCMFTILIQISREYTRLLKDLTKINEMYDESFNMVKEVNPLLRKKKTKSFLKQHCMDQQQLFEFTKDFELSYSYSMLMQVFVVSFLVIVTAVLCLLEFADISITLCHLIGYICIVVLDLFLLCWLATRIRSQCLQVGQEAYSILWYEMDVDIQKDICMIIMRSQRPPKITSGKIMEVNLHTFMLVMRNIYSWLALFQQLAVKSN